ncbi:MAG: MFS transporter [Candidatus Cloacimonetes bacterium]|nr:MFS transporter [Candidatus Cloacimonadota bacterium]
MKSSVKQNWYGSMVIITSWLAVFCLFGYRATFALLKDPMSSQLGWSQAEISLGYSLMMLFYAVTAFISGLLLDKWGTRPAYIVAAIFSFLGFFLTSYMSNFYLYLFTFGLLGGIATGMLWVTSTVSVRKWFIGKTYGTMWGLVFMGAPLSQLLLTNLTRILMDYSGTEDWRLAMRYLSYLMLTAMLLAVLLAKRNPEDYGYKPVGYHEQSEEKTMTASFTLRKSYSYYAIWGVILTFLFSMMAEFLIWTQIVSYWTGDLLLPRSQAIRTYSLIGLLGIFTMPIMGILADQLVKKSKRESEGRKMMLTIGTVVGLLACLLLLYTGNSLWLIYFACLFFAIYWAVIPGGVIGYTGAIYGTRNLGKIWGLATLIVMGIGPFTGTFIGGLLKDISGVYRYSIYFSLFSFLLAVIFSCTLPKRIEIKNLENL